METWPCSLAATTTTTATSYSLAATYTPAPFLPHHAAWVPASKRERMVSCLGDRPLVQRASVQLTPLRPRRRRHLKFGCQRSLLLQLRWLPPQAPGPRQILQAQKGAADTARASDSSESAGFLSSGSDDGWIGMRTATRKSSALRTETTMSGRSAISMVGLRSNWQSSTAMTVAMTSAQNAPRQCECGSLSLVSGPWVVVWWRCVKKKYKVVDKAAGTAGTCSGLLLALRQPLLLRLVMSFTLVLYSPVSSLVTTANPTAPLARYARFTVSVARLLL